jgi:hypothetical protein
MKLKNGVPTTASMGALLARTGVSGKTFLMATTYGQERSKVPGQYNALIIRDNKHWQSDFDKLQKVLDEKAGVVLRLVELPQGMKHGVALVHNTNFDNGFQLENKNV